MAFAGYSNSKAHRASDSGIGDEPSDTVAVALPGGKGETSADSVAQTAGQPDEYIDEDSLLKRETVTAIDRRKVDIEDVVKFHATDSLVMSGRNNTFMYGGATVEYTDLKLNSDNIKMDMDSSTVFAEGRVDSLGSGSGYPVFSDKGGTYESKTMKYNFKSQRGFITDVVTEQGEGYLQGGATKKMEDGTFFVEDGKYTTCDDHEHPHFYFQLTKAKVTPKKNIVTGPAYLVLSDVPLPLAVPFGFFPFSKDYSSGVLFPSFGDDYNQGFYLRDGGYYFAINDYVDLALRGE
ncbi:MAG TPA: kinase, partial [Porphyromonadaceae bacterium]|nr:kinase [Porphyromonadaceae bacterium]